MLYRVSFRKRENKKKKVIDLPGLYLVFRPFWVVLGFTGFYWVLLGFTGLYWVLLGFPGLDLVIMGFSLIRFLSFGIPLRLLLVFFYRFLTGLKTYFFFVLPPSFTRNKIGKSKTIDAAGRRTTFCDNHHASRNRTRLPLNFHVFLYFFGFRS